VQSSNLASGARWEPRQLDQVRVPNLAKGGEIPDYIVVSEEYAKVVPSQAEPERRVLRELCQGHLGYDLVASFKTPTFVPIRHLPINPRILIFDRGNSHSGQRSESIEIAQCLVSVSG
jgi:hypothetical protein